jgi:hypothetical protein
MPITHRTWKTGTTRRTTGKYGYKYGKTYSGNTGNMGRSSYATTWYHPNKYNTYKKTLQAKICSYRTINQQFTGTGKVTAFSPAGANKWIKYVDQGAWVYKFSTPQFCKFWGNNWNSPTPTVAFRYLQKKFGTCIKGVTQGKGNYWLVAATPKLTARPFSTYIWK